ncbi:MAG: histidinol dehydrogenase [Verrucomicrobia bacterium Tous-C9LFEB]|nr:MAG: histidinol dehydrogenase [Verrucomicrobia bacterium Tous-C9LFEB]
MSLNISERIVRYTDKNYAATLAALNRAAQPEESVVEAVRAIVNEVRANGDKALEAFTAKFDKKNIKAKDFLVTRKSITPEAKAKGALNHSLANVTAFAKANLPKAWNRKNREGATVGEIYHPFQRVGVNVPGFSAPLVSTAIMTVAIAKAAGVPEIVVATPPPVNDLMLYTLRLAGATEIYQVGGAHAMAALAYGTKTIKRVNKIFGPGNKYVVEAKRQVLGAVAIDQLPGPSEIAVIADDSARPDFIAADLLAQAEHGPGSQILFVTASKKLLAAVVAALETQLPQLERQEYLAQTLKNSRLLLTRNLKEAIQIVEDFAPEHTSLVVKNGRALAKTMRNSGAIFVGNYSPVAAGDYIAGPSHTLPTGGAAKSFPGLTVDQFYKRTSIVEYSKESIRKAAPNIAILAGLEKLDAHAKSARIRVD